MSGNNIKCEPVQVTSLYSLIGNIPPTFHASDLRNFFSQFVESEQFECFHFRHRPQIINIRSSPYAEGASTCNSNSEVESSNAPDVESRLPLSFSKETMCAIVSFSKENSLLAFYQKYHGKFWMDKAGTELQGRCIIQKVRLSAEEVVKFSKELRPPRLMPRGNVGTPNSHFLNLLKQCKLPPNLVKKLGLEFPRAR